MLSPADSEAAGRPGARRLKLGYNTEVRRVFSHHQVQVHVTRRLEGIVYARPGRHWQRTAASAATFHLALGMMAPAPDHDGGSHGPTRSPTGTGRGRSDTDRTRGHRHGDGDLDRDSVGRQPAGGPYDLVRLAQRVG